MRECFEVLCRHDRALLRLEVRTLSVRWILSVNKFLEDGALCVDPSLREVSGL